MALNNSWRLFQLQNNSKISSIEFRKQLMLQLCADMPMPFLHKTRKRTHNSINNNNAAHCPVLQLERGRCVVCTAQNIDHRGYMKCVTCNVYLCANRNCFAEYHSE